MVKSIFFLTFNSSYIFKNLSVENKRRFLKKVKYRNLSNFVFINKNPFGFLQNYPSMIKGKNKKEIPQYFIHDKTLCYQRHEFIMS